MMRFRHSLQSVLLGATFLVAPSVLLAQEASLTSATPTSSKSDQTSQQSEASTVLEWITVEGAQRVERETVLAYMVIREGMVATPKLINQSIKTLFGSGLFADVSVRRDGKGIVVSVVENPIINRISFEGNSKINDDMLQMIKVLSA
jgi:outer membrane protein insertion porin family